MRPPLLARKQTNNVGVFEATYMQEEFLDERGCELAEANQWRPREVLEFPRHWLYRL
jgi:hypothetical protein